MPGIVIDSFVYSYIGDWHWLRDGEQSDGKPIGTYEKNLYSDCPYWSLNLYAPGSGTPVYTSDSLGALKKVLDYMSKE